MKIVIIGATGTLGTPIANELSKIHEVIRVGHTKGDLNVDIRSKDSIDNLFQQVGEFDALISATGSVHFGEFAEMKDEDFYLGIESKMMGQINLVRKGLNYINESGSFTLTSGILADVPIPLGLGASMINGALNSFVKAAAIQMPNKVRINIISPGLVKDSEEEYADFFPGHQAIEMDRMVHAYVDAVEGSMNGDVIKIY